MLTVIKIWAAVIDLNSQFKLTSNMLRDLSQMWTWNSMN